MASIISFLNLVLGARIRLVKDVRLSLRRAPLLVLTFVLLAAILEFLDLLAQWIFFGNFLLAVHLIMNLKNCLMMLTGVIVVDLVHL